jgi:hypothetical protein
MPAQVAKLAAGIEPKYRAMVLLAAYCRQIPAAVTVRDAGCGVRRVRKDP